MVMGFLSRDAKGSSYHKSKVKYEFTISRTKNKTMSYLNELLKAADQKLWRLIVAVIKKLTRKQEWKGEPQH